MFDETAARLAIVRVGDGRGFIIKTSLGRLVITAAHCLPHLPETFSFARPGELVYQNLIGLPDTEPTINAECYFGDPVSDIAVVGPPDEQAFPNDCKAYDTFMARLMPLPVSDVPEGGPGYMLSLDGQWAGCSVLTLPGGGPYWIECPATSIAPAMSGSPILSEDGRGIGVICTATDTGDEPPGTSSTHGPNPRLTQNLPGWLLHQLKLSP